METQPNLLKGEAAQETLPEIYRDFPKGSNRMEKTMLAVYRSAIKQVKDPKTDAIPFTKEQIVEHGTKLHDLKLVSKKLPVKNVPDIIYTFRARADLPDEIRKDGEVAIIGGGKGHYSFVRIPIPNRIRINGEIEQVVINDVVPQWVQPYMGTDEQGTLTRVAANGLVKNYLGLKEAFRLQSHRRMGVDAYGQVEVDEVYAGITTDDKHIIIGVEAKDKGDEDLLNVSQLYGTTMGLKSIAKSLATELKAEVMAVRLLGVKPDLQGRICMCEFTVADQPAGVQALANWKAYVLRS